MIQPWHWLVLAVLLLIFEVLGAGGFVIGLAIAAFVLSIIAVSFENLSWDFQLLLFALSGIAFTVIYWRFFRKFNNRTDQPDINNRAAQYIGRSFQTTKPLIQGEGKEQVGDSLWRVRCAENIDEGTSVKVVGSEGMVLIIEKIE